MNSFVCAICNVAFKKKSSCARHIKNKKCFSSENRRRSVCTNLVKNKKDPNVETLQFASNADFLLWKDNEEQRTLSKYSQDYGMWKTKKGKKIRYKCHRAGNARQRVKEPSTRKRRLKMKGSCKINNHCTAYMLYEESFDGKITVRYNPIHCNHELEIKHLPISSVDKENIAEKLKIGVPLDQVLDDIRETLDGDTHFTRTQLITKHELHNIMREKNISYQESKSMVDLDDTGSVELIINEYREKFGNDTPFKYYKEQGEKKDQFEDDDFLLVIMNSVQINLMKQFGSDKVCVDSIHATNDCEFYLNTVMVVNDLDMCVPVAHAISNKQNTELIKFFFEIIKQECGVIRTNTFMSDDFPVYLNAWTMVMEKPNNILLCHWQVDEDWRKNLKLVNGSKNLKDEVYKLVRTLMKEKNEASFPYVVTLAVEKLMTDPNTKEFGRYFEREYSKSYEKWAFAFRKYIGINTNTKIEAMHRELKNVYHRKLKNKRLEMLITTLLRMNRNKVFDRVSHLIMETDPNTLRKVRDRHKKGEKIPAEDVSIIGDNIGNVKSQSNQSSNYVIKKIADECYCRLRCADCQGICVHLYECTCDDYVYGYNICKHIHAYALRIQVLELPPDRIDNEDENVAEVQNIFPIIQIQEIEVESAPKTRESMIEVVRQILQNIDRCEGMEVDEDDRKALCLLQQVNKMLEMKLKRIIENTQSSIYYVR